jgi:putative membrane protein
VLSLPAEAVHSKRNTGPAVANRLYGYKKQLQYFYRFTEFMLVTHKKYKIVWISIFCIVFVWSVINPKDYLTWFLESFPAMIAVVVMAATMESFRLTPLLYVLILLHCIILLVGAHYTYAEVPLFDYIQDLFQLERNNYDKLGHIAQGFVPAIVAREILIRKRIIIFPKWRIFFILCIILSVSAFYEMFEWWVAVASEEAAEAFLGMQGYAWDTQSDMFLALVGAVSALILLSKMHDKQIAELQNHKR